MILGKGYVMCKRLTTDFFLKLIQLKAYEDFGFGFDLVIYVFSLALVECIIPKML
jgi:hypothetical protein